jgi:hypothetical protein
VQARFGGGELSFSQVRAITRIAGPGNEAALVELALHSTAAQLEQAVRATARAEKVDDGPGEPPGPELHAGCGEDGLWTLTVRGLAPEDGAAIEAALRLLVDRQPVDEGSAEPFPVRRAAALVEMADIAFHADEADKPVSTGDRYQVLVVADENGCHLDHGPDLSDETASRLACDASVVLLRTHHGEPLDVGRKSRTTPPSIRRVLERRDGGCRFPACGRRVFTHAHHVLHWTRGGSTSVDNLLLLCSHHHHLVHEGGWHVTGHPDTEFRFHAPDGRDVTAHPARHVHGPDIRTRHRRQGLAIDHTTSVSRWTGEPLDLALAVDALLPSRAPT